ncbi:YciI family protein [Antrihabitans cavernicola]|uniref:Transcription initiation protein n=1 Tax=Antrihabitans cavernicola TaxID=2495913 RepID=A0A5A7S3F9_9NOCA|nr:YciI family protein [Spelaeibacter cavernicola]KAA0019425.1 transcription initiation protein [Spelaeibacter cavernicola]
MKYLLMIATDESDPTELVGCTAWVDDMRANGVLLDLAGLQRSSDATTVRVRGDEVLLTDGPFAETKDQIGGFGVIECADLDEAIEVAAKHPAAYLGCVEVRPLLEP